MGSWHRGIEALSPLIACCLDPLMPRPFDCLAIARNVLHAQIAKFVAAAFQLRIQALQHAQAKLAVGFDRHRPRVRQRMCGIGLEFHAFLEVDQVELDFLRRIPKRKIGDHRMQQRGLAGASLAGDQRMLRGALPQREVLEFGRARPAERHSHFAVSVERPHLIQGRGDDFKRHFDAAGILRGLADRVQFLGDELIIGRRIKRERETRVLVVLPRETA